MANRQPTTSTRIGEMALSLPNMVADAILQDILRGELAPGSRLTETSLAEQHAVSRSTVREALAQLERQHFIERIPRYGARVAQVDLGETEELFEIRSSLLALAAKRACRFADEDGLTTLHNMTEKLESLAANDATLATDYSYGVYELQAYLIQVSGSRWLMTLYEQIAEQTIWRAMVRYRGIGFADPDRRRGSASDWRNVTDAVGRRDALAAEAATKALMDASLAYIRMQFSKKEKE